MKNTEIIRLGAGLEIHILLDADETNQKLTMFQVVIHPGAKVPTAHFHEHFDETIYGVKGLISLTVDGKTMDLRPGECCFIPRGVVHQFENKTSNTAELLAISTPGVFGSAYFRELEPIINAGGPPDMAKLKNIMLSYGLVPVVG